MLINPSTACLVALALPCLTWARIINHESHSHGSPTTKAPSTTTVKATTVCTSTATATWYATSGCDIPCGTQAQCIADNAVAVPCGCDRVSVTVTTKTVCPTVAPCIQCYTGWGIATYFLPCSTRSVSPTPLVTSVMRA
ncbi:hypothetical protein QBC34DRAFT_424943 [Podospora aff. communis PSN243]|uniref:Extracellular membrane protein CFEM domain-containing protein n=1 Tax=Podospora aff. communis PSN243 TaxID=3040156 RepID=A0AAV9GNF2_9PEZI|nr:hypothetical protein QBC34DRAFT_424943 [Podospora aff. communis PSN243]